MTADLKSVADELYALPVGEFTAARNARAKQTRAVDAALAKAIGALPRPSLAAWVVNILVRDEPEHVERVLALGEELRQAQELLDARQLRELGAQRRKLTAAVTRQARDNARERGVEVTEPVATQVEQTLHAAMIDEYAARAVRTALLIKALPSSGLDELDVSQFVAVPDAIGSARALLHVVPALEESEDDERARLAAIEDARSATRKQRKAQERLDAAQRDVTRFEARDTQIDEELDDLERQLGALRRERDAVELDLAAARDRLRRAREQYDAARLTAERASAALEARVGDDVP
ncbi:hypothetical protein CLV47_1362 [Antricoccus suffuscus]|uniref:Uncharacterized protein n=1 Tax=Antricoccus suffuscus TaxID=1629062 RepID=A0A2T0YY35_9ACTN|nr:hypothetical protein [Antricoccus suffuscus]PRZ29015.1 hypothetical protein CLV47_1362 [Antricoccus suffuscus]